MRGFGATLTLLFLATVVVAGVALYKGLTGWFEAVGFVTGALCVWLTAKENIWNWPIGLVNAAASAVVYFEARLTNDGTLQIVYFVLGVLGWYWWLHGGEKKTALKIDRTPARQWMWILVVGVAATIALTVFNYRIHGAAPALDASTTVVSLAAQYLLTRKYIENWLLWIAVDLVYVPLLLWKGLYLFAILYVIFTFMAIGGLRAWTRLRSGTSESPPLWRPVLACLGLGMGVWAWMGWKCWQFETFFAESLQTVRASSKATLTPTGGPKTDIEGDAFVLLKAEVLDPLAWSPAPAQSGADGKPPPNTVALLDFHSGSETFTFELNSYQQAYFLGRAAAVEPWFRWLPLRFPDPK